jgi:hypothetical protein
MVRGRDERLCVCGVCVTYGLPSHLDISNPVCIDSRHVYSRVVTTWCECVCVRERERERGEKEAQEHGHLHPHIRKNDFWVVCTCKLLTVKVGRHGKTWWCARGRRRSVVRPHPELARGSILYRSMLRSHQVALCLEWGCRAKEGE